ncbi:hypothetical protein RSAG8_10288, partial [Rhizoctonia solani AG-8 WAC10335]
MTNSTARTCTASLLISFPHPSPHLKSAPRPQSYPHQNLKACPLSRVLPPMTCSVMSVI